MEKECFVIQPFNDVKFKKRFDDIYKPAIEAADLTAYRVDLDPYVRIPIEDIEFRIKNAEICFAEISVDNPNVWYELGYAFALGKDVVMICDDNRKEFPFDIRHKNIIKYKSDSPSDFESLKEQITRRLKSYLETQIKTKSFIENPIKETEGLQPYELTLIAFLIGEQFSDDETVSAYTLKEKMSKVGFNNTAFSIGLRLLKSKGYIDTQIESDYNGNEYSTCFLTEKGNDFILKNTHLFDLQQSKITQSDIDDLPF